MDHVVLDLVLDPASEFPVSAVPVVVLLPTGVEEFPLQEQAHRALGPWAVFVSRAAAIALAADERNALVCDLTGAGLRAYGVEVRDREVSVTTRAIRPDLGTRAFLDDTARRLGGMAGAALYEVLAHRERRVVVTVTAARNNALLRDTPINPDERNPIEAGFLADRFDEYAQALFAGIEEIKEGTEATVLAGDLPCLSLLAERGAVFTGQEVIERAAAAFVDGAFRESGRGHVVARLPVNRVADGLLEEGSVLLQARPGAFAEFEGGEFRVAVGGEEPGALALDGMMMKLDLDDGGSVEFDLSALPPGAYRMGLRAGAEGQIVAALVGRSGAMTYVETSA